MIQPVLLPRPSTLSPAALSSPADGAAFAAAFAVSVDADSQIMVTSPMQTVAAPGNVLPPIGDAPTTLDAPDVIMAVAAPIAAVATPVVAGKPATPAIAGNRLLTPIAAVLEEAAETPAEATPPPPPPTPTPLMVRAPAPPRIANARPPATPRARATESDAGPARPGEAETDGTLDLAAPTASLIATNAAAPTSPAAVASPSPAASPAPTPARMRTSVSSDAMAAALANPPTTETALVSSRGAVVAQDEAAPAADADDAGDVTIDRPARPESESEAGSTAIASCDASTTALAPASPTPVYQTPTTPPPAPTVAETSRAVIATPAPDRREIAQSPGVIAHAAPSPTEAGSRDPAVVPSPPRRAPPDATALPQPAVIPAGFTAAPGSGGSRSVDAAAEASLPIPTQTDRTTTQAPAAVVVPAASASTILPSPPARAAESTTTRPVLAGAVGGAAIAPTATPVVPAIAAKPPAPTPADLVVTQTSKPAALVATAAISTPAPAPVVALPSVPLAPALAPRPIPVADAVDLAPRAEAFVPTPLATPAPDPAVAQPGPAPLAETPSRAQARDVAPRAAPAMIALPVAEAPAAIVTGATAPAFRIFAAALHAARADEAGPSDPLAPAPVAALDPTRAAPPVTAPGGAALDMSDRRWPHSMVERIETLRDAASAAADAADTSIRLVPASLGTIDVSVRRDGETVHVHFAAEQAATRTLLVEAQPRLAELAEARGLKLGEASVGAGSAGSGGPNGRQPQQPPQPGVAAPARAPRDEDPDIATTRIA